GDHELPPSIPTHSGVVPAKAGTHNHRFSSLRTALLHRLLTAYGSRLRRDDSREASRDIGSPPRLKSERLLWIEHRDHPQRATFAIGPPPREREERAALAGDLVDISTDVLDARNAVRHHDLVRGLPVRKVLDDVTAGLGLVLGIEMRLRRPRPMRPQEGAERVI